MERRLAAILAADVVGYTRLMGDDEAGTLRRLTALREEALEPLIAEHGGRIVKLIGDGMLVEFSSVVDAVTCAVAWQKEVSELEDSDDDDIQLQFRIGINLGDVIVEGDDIHGDGVNIAARLEGLAEPGSICLSGDAYRQAKRKVEAEFEDLGEQDLKNVADPIRIYRIAGARSSSSAVSPATETLSLPGRPSIAVLPFDNLSGDSSQEYFVDGLTEDVITELSRFRDLFVISRHSTFAYKNKQVRIQDVGRELGARYVLEGSIQKSSRTLRISAQLLEAHTGRHIWARRYDCELKDVFDVRDDVTQSIAGTLLGDEGQLTRSELGRSLAKNTARLDAYDYLLRGGHEQYKFTKESNLLARRYYEKAMKLDPTFSEAFSAVASTYSSEVEWGWSDNSQDSLEHAHHLAHKALVLDDSNYHNYWVLSVVNLFRREHEKALSAYHRAYELNPNDANLLLHMSSLLIFVGKPKEAVANIKRAMRLNPLYPERYLGQLGWALSEDERYDEAIKTYTQISSPEPWIHLELTELYVHNGRMDLARKHAKAYLRLDPDFSLKMHAEMFRVMNPYQDTAVLEERLTMQVESLRAAGLPD